jgi:hypothetical protein
MYNMYVYTTYLVHTLSSVSLLMLKGAYKSYVEVRNEISNKKNLLLYDEIQ